MKGKSKLLLARELRYEAVHTFATLMTSAFGLVAALAWNETVKGAIDRYISPGNGLRSKFYYAFVVTLLAIFVSYELGKMVARFKIDKEESENQEEK